MAEIKSFKKACSVNPLKTSAPLGAAMAYLGLDGCLPLFHGSQGCTAFALVLLVRHFREAIPFQTTAMNEITTILGGADNLEQAVLNIHKRAKPAVIGICSTGLTETRGEDFPADIAEIAERNADVLGDTQLVFASTPDYKGGLQDGWAAAVEAVIRAQVQAGSATAARQVNILAGAHMTPGDIEEIRDICELFGLKPIILPDLSGSLDGHVPDRYIPTTYGGTTMKDVRAMGRSVHTIAIGRHMAAPAQALEAMADVPYTVLDGLTGLEASDRLMVLLSELSGKAVPDRLKRQRSQLVDAMLDAHFFFGGRKIAIAAEPDLLFALSGLFADLGAEVAGVTTTDSPLLAEVKAETVVVGDLEDLETVAVGADLIVAHSHGRHAAQTLGLPLVRAGFPSFDRLGAAHVVSIGYRGTRERVFEIANVLMDAGHAHHDHDEEAGHGHGPQAAAG